MIQNFCVRLCYYYEELSIDESITAITTKEKARG